MDTQAQSKQKPSSSIPASPGHPAADPNPAQPDVFAAGPGVAAPTPFTSINRSKIIVVLSFLVFLGVIIIFLIFSS